MTCITKIKSLAIFAVMLVAMSSCTKNFKEWNTNPNEATPGDVDKYNTYASFITTMQKDIIPTTDESANDFQRAQNLAGDIFSGHMATITGWNGSKSQVNYCFDYDWHDVAFRVHFQTVMAAWSEIKEMYGEKNPSIFAVAEILKVMSTQRVTDMYGPIPQLSYGQSQTTAPYDSQEAIYKAMFEDLNGAIEVLVDFNTRYPDSKPLVDFDAIYGGDYSKWIKLANSMKLRMAMRIRYVEPALAEQYAKEAVEAGVITENSDNASLKTYGSISIMNPLPVIWDKYGDIRMGASMESYLTGYNDPRISAYFQKQSFDKSDADYHGVRNGMAVNDDDRNNYLKFSSPNIFGSAPVKLMCASEVSFLMAEAALMGWLPADQAQTYYEQGIKLSFSEWSAPIGNYLTQTDATPAEYSDPYSGVNLAALSTITIPWDDAAGTEKNLERIITQKWLALYPEGQEAWSEFRRTGYPRIFPIASNRGDGTVDTNIQIRRLEFPRAEYEGLNSAEVYNAAALLEGGQDSAGARLWWDAK